MPLDGAAYRASLSWRHTRQNDGFLNATQGPDSIALSNDETGADAVFAGKTTLAASASKTFNLQSLTSLLSQSINFVDINAAMVQVVSGDAILTPGASNPASLFMGGTSPGIVMPEGSFVIASSTSSVDATHKNVDVTAGISGCQFRVALLGGV